MMYLNHLEKILSDEVKKEKEAESKSSSNYFGGGFGGFIIMSEPEPEEEAKEEEKEELTKEQQLLKSINNILVLKATTNFLATVRIIHSLQLCDVLFNFFFFFIGMFITVTERNS